MTKTGSEVEVVSHSDTDSDVVMPGHYLIPFLLPSLLISVRSPPSFFFLSSSADTKLSALRTFLTIYVGQGQDRLKRSASLSPSR